MAQEAEAPTPAHAREPTAFRPMVSKAQAAQIDASDTADPEEIEWYMQSEIAHAAASDPEGSSDPRAHATESVASEPIWDHSEDEGNAEQEANDADPIWDHS